MMPGLAPFLAVYTLAVVTPCAAPPYPTEAWKAWLGRKPHRYPRKTWARHATPEEAGWSSEKLGKAHDHFRKIGSAAVMVVYDGAVLVQWGDVDRRYMCHSVRKSFLSALYGIHVAEGHIDPNKTMADLGIDDVPPLTEAEKRARVIDLLRSRSGIYHPAAYETSRMKMRRPKRGSHRPGEYFWYNNWDFNALCTIFEKETGTKVFEEFERRFARPLEMEDFRLQDTYYHLEKENSIHPAYPFRMSARDMARFGLLFLRQGRWRDKQVLSEEWVKVSTASHFREPDTTPNRHYAYGYLWWRIVDGPFKELGMYSARGYGGHSIDVIPAADLVFVHRVDTYWDLSSHLRRARKRVADAQRFELLDLVLKARISAPRAKPKTVSLRRVSRHANVVKLPPKVLKRYAGEYDFGGFRLRVKAMDDRLLIGTQRMGDFGLLPLSQTRFVIEDIEAPGAFELDGSGRPSGMTVEFAPGKTSRGRAAACGSSQETQ